MKRTLSLQFLLLAAVIGIAVTGCKPRQQSLTPIPGSGGTTVGGPDDGGAFGPGEVVEADPFGVEAFQGRATESNSNKDREFFQAQTVYFDFDSSVIRPSEISKIQVVADHLNANSTHSVRVEGHCDERGTEEYNRALGERRANSVRESLISMGVSADAVFTVSYGEDIPAVEGSNESAWSKNRRGEFVLLTPIQ